MVKRNQASIHLEVGLLEEGQLEEVSMKKLELGNDLKVLDQEDCKEV